MAPLSGCPEESINMNACPSHEQLQQLLTGRLSEFDQSAVRAHVDTCFACQQTVTSLGSSQHRTRVWQPPDLAAASKEAAALPPQLRDHPRYRIVELLDVGGMGAVYRADHRLLERAVVLKIVRPDVLSHPETVQRFLREAKLAASLIHPNIVTLY